ncbi:hypothetical protein ACROYT_G043820 [Oculina patagonica]
MWRCGTRYPGWLNGAHPSVAEGVVTRRVCYTASRNCCVWQNNIKVKNCSGFYVYELQKPPRCSLRYCGNAGAVHGCQNYTVLSEADRAQGNAVKNNLCDRDLVTGWYRFQGDAGDQMPDKCVPSERCGTVYPGWLSGAHPSVAEGVVTLKVCYGYYTCCLFSNNIKVKNCSGFYVYESQRPRLCNLRYCGNAGAVDGCKNVTVLSEAGRAQGNAVKNNLCDMNLIPEDAFMLSTVVVTTLVSNKIAINFAITTDKKSSRKNHNNIGFSFIDKTVIIFANAFDKVSSRRNHHNTSSSFINKIVIIVNITCNHGNSSSRHIPNSLAKVIISINNTHSSPNTNSSKNDVTICIVTAIIGIILILSPVIIIVIIKNSGCKESGEEVYVYIGHNRCPAKHFPTETVVVGIVYKALHELFIRKHSKSYGTDDTRRLNSPIVAVTMSPKPGILQENVTLIFRHLKIVDGKGFCVFWNGFGKERKEGF